MKTKPTPTNSKPKTKAIRRYRVLKLYQFSKLLRPDQFTKWYEGLEKEAKKPENKTKNIYSDSLKELTAEIPFINQRILNGLASQLPAMIQIAKTENTLRKASDLWDSYWKPLEGKGSISWTIKQE